MGPSNTPPPPILTKGGKRNSMRKSTRKAKRKNGRNKSRSQHKRR